MFPLNWNIPFIRKNGSRTTLGAITGDIAGIEEDVSEITEKTDGLLDNMLDNGAVNLLPSTGTSQEYEGVTYSIAADGTITCTTTGTRTSNSAIDISDYAPAVGTYRVTGLPSTGDANSTFCFRYILYYTDNTDSGWMYLTSVDEDLITIGTNVKRIRVQLYFKANYSPNGLVFKPMFSDPSLNLSYGDYVPYAKSNRELTINLDEVAKLYSDGVTLEVTDDCDTPLLIGNSLFTINKFVNTTPNTPGGGGALISWSSSNKYGAQIALNDNGLFYRKNVNGTISTWQNLIS